MAIEIDVQDQKGLRLIRFLKDNNTLQLMFNPQIGPKDRVEKALETLDKRLTGSFRYHVEEVPGLVAATIGISALFLRPFFEQLLKKDIVSDTALPKLSPLFRGSTEATLQDDMLTLSITDSQAILKHIGLDWQKDKIHLTFNGKNGRDEASRILREDYNTVNRFGLLGLTAGAYECRLLIDCADLGQTLPVLACLRDKKLLHQIPGNNNNIYLYAQIELKLDALLQEKRRAMGLDKAENRLCLPLGSPLLKLHYQPELRRLEAVIDHTETGDTLFKEMQRKIKQRDYKSILIKEAKPPVKSHSILLTHDNRRTPEETLQLFTDMDGSQPSLGLLTRKQYEFARLNLDLGAPVKPTPGQPQPGNRHLMR